MKFVHVTDPHLVPPGQTLYDLDPRARLDACVDSINREHGDAFVAVFTGDLVHRGEAAAYESLREALGRLRIPHRLVLGNHDSRESFREIFPDAAEDDHGFIQSRMETPAGHFVFLDTLEMGRPWGVLCERRLAWLESALSHDRVAPVYLFMHHPPFETGVPRMDESMLREPGRFAAVLARFPGRVRHIFFGHMHRPVAGSWKGIPVSTMRGTAHQVALDFSPAPGPVRGSHEPPAYGVVFLESDRVVVHFHDFMDRTATFDL